MLQSKHVWIQKTCLRCPLHFSALLRSQPVCIFQHHSALSASWFVGITPLLSGFFRIIQHVCIFHFHSIIGSYVFINVAPLSSVFVGISQCDWILYCCSTFSASRFVGVSPISSGFISIAQRFFICLCHTLPQMLLDLLVGEVYFIGCYGSLNIKFNCV